MSFDDVFRFVLALLALGLLAGSAYALWTGRLRIARGTYLRSERPADYWRELLLLALPGAIILCWLLFVPVPADRSPAYGPMFIFAIVGPQLLASLWSGRIEYARACISRREEPRRYWTWLSIGVALLGFGLFVLLRELPAWPPPA